MLKRITLLLIVALFSVLPLLAQTEDTVVIEDISEVIKMPTATAEIVFLLDRSGSMMGKESDTIGGFNEFVRLQAAEGATSLTTILFDDKYEVLHNGVNAEGIQITKKDYFVRGNTAMLDAIGKAINNLENRLLNTPPEEKKDKVFFVITTDGYENASKEYTYETIRELIKKKQNESDWIFLFFGANIDVAKEADKLNILAVNAFTYSTVDTVSAIGGLSGGAAGGVGANGSAGAAGDGATASSVGNASGVYNVFMDANTNITNMRNYIDVPAKGADIDPADSNCIDNNTDVLNAPTLINLLPVNNNVNNDDDTSNSLLSTAFFPIHHANSNMVLVVDLQDPEANRIIYVNNYDIDFTTINTINFTNTNAINVSNTQNSITNINQEEQQENER